jgi:hypothetical protein
MEHKLPCKNVLAIYEDSQLFPLYAVSDFAGG